MKCPICEVTPVTPEEDGKIPDCWRCRSVYLDAEEYPEEDAALFRTHRVFSAVLHAYVPDYGDYSVDEYLNALE
jgi:Zn-finger nucleic acid-binding protein